MYIFSSKIFPFHSHPNLRSQFSRLISKTLRMANHGYHELPEQQPPSPPPRSPLAPPSSTIRVVLGDDPSIVPLPLFTQRSKSTILKQNSGNPTSNFTSRNHHRPTTSAATSSGTSIFDDNLSSASHRPTRSFGSSPALPPPRIYQSNPNVVHYTRDSHRVVAYLIPLPKPIHVSDAIFPQVRSKYGNFISMVH